MQWKIIELWEIGDKEWIEMAKESGEKRSSVLREPREQIYKRRHGVVSNAMIEESMSDCIVNKIHHYSGKIVLKSAIKIAKLIFLTLELVLYLHPAYH